MLSPPSSIFPSSLTPSSSREAPPIAAVVLSKVLQTASLFWAYGILRLLPLAVFMFAIKAASAAVYVLLQRPLSSGKKISRAMVGDEYARNISVVFQ